MVSSGRLKASHKAFSTRVYTAVGKRLAEWRAGAGLTQSDVAIPLGVSMQQVQRYEAGQTGMLVSTLISAARICGCRPSDLLVDFEDGAIPPAALTPEAVAIAKVVDGIKNGGLRGIVKAVADAIRRHERNG